MELMIEKLYLVIIGQLCVLQFFTTDAGKEVKYILSVFRCNRPDGEVGHRVKHG